MNRKFRDFLDINQEYFQRFLDFLQDIHCDAFFQKIEIEKNSENLKFFGPAVYIQLRKDMKVYVGETVNLSQRTVSHLGNGVEIECMGAIAAWMFSDEERLEEESYVIQEASLAGFPLANAYKVEDGSVKNPEDSQKNEKPDCDEKPSEDNE